MATHDIWMLAANGGGGGGGGGGAVLLIGVILMVVVFYVTLSGDRKEKKRQRELLASLKKNDRVMTLGGVIGTVVNIQPNEITLKVDESANVKITFVRSAIQRVLADEEKT